MFADILSQPRFQYVVDDQILRHGLAGRAALGDDVEHRLFYVDHIQQSAHTFGIDVVFYIKFRRFANGFRQIVVMQMTERLKNGDGAQSGPRRFRARQNNRTSF